MHASPRDRLPRVKTTRVNSLGELIDAATPLEPDPVSGRMRASSVYRGVAQNGGRLLTSLDRLGGTEPPHTKVHLEEHLLRNFIRYGKQFLPEHRENLWEIMVIAEHHGLPTRLLDWTHSPLVAAHFATLPTRSNMDRVIWKLNWKMVHERFGLRRVAFLVEDLAALLRERGLPRDWEFLQARFSPEQQLVCLLEPPAFTERLSVQAGAFTFSSVATKALDQVLAEAGIADALTQFVIPAARVDFLRDQLDLCTVDERRLFPGLDGVAAELRRYYSAGEGVQAGDKECADGGA
jgi:hypothetical protein